MTEALDNEIRTLRAHFWSERDPEGRAFVPLADAYLRKGDLDEARALLDDGLGRLPDFASGHLIAARVHRARNDAESAHASVERLRELDPDNAAGLRLHGELLEEEGRLEEALDAFRRAWALNPDYDDLEGRTSRLEVKVSGEDPAETGRGVEGIVTGADVYTGTLAEDEVDEEPEEEVPEADLEPSESASDEGEMGDPFDSLTPWADPDDPDPLDVDFQDIEEGETDVESEDGLDTDFEDFEALELETPGEVEEDDFELDSGWEDAELAHPPEAVEEEVEIVDSPDEGAVSDFAPPGDEPSPTVTRTLGELYLRQGLTGRAVEVFEELVRRNPEDEALRSRLDEIREGSGEEASESGAESGTSTDGEPISRIEPLSDTEPLSDIEPDARAAPPSDTDFDATPVAEEEPEEEVWDLPVEPEVTAHAGDEDAPDDLPERSSAWADEGVEESTEDLHTPFAWDSDEEEVDVEASGGEEEARTTPPARTIGGYLNDLRAWVPGAVPVESLDPSAVPIEALAPREEGPESPPERDAPELDPDATTGDGDLDDFQEWLRGLRS